MLSKKIQKEFERATQYSIHQENRIEFVLQYYKNENITPKKIKKGKKERQKKHQLTMA